MSKFQTKWHQRVPNSLGDPTWESVDGQWTIVRVASKCRDRKARFEIRQFGTYLVTIGTVGVSTHAPSWCPITWATSTSTTYSRRSTALTP